MLKRLLIVTMLLVVAFALPALAQGDISAQVLRLLGRANYWTNLNTFAQTMGIKLERGVLAPVPSVTDRLYNLAGTLYWNCAPGGSGGGGVSSITAGTGISVTGTSSIPIVGLSNQISAGSCTDCNPRRSVRRWTALPRIRFSCAASAAKRRQCSRAQSRTGVTSP